MNARILAAALAVAAIAGLALAPPAQAQQPSKSAVALARQVLDLKGGIEMFDPVFVGVIEHHRNVFSQANPPAAGILNEVTNNMRKELAHRQEEIRTQIATAYAEQFSERELKEVLAFYKTPLGRKLIEAEPKALDAAADRVDKWAAKFAQEVNDRIRAEMKKRGVNLL